MTAKGKLLAFVSAALCSTGRPGKPVARRDQMTKVSRTVLVRAITPRAR
jgi:hypothetical protein